MDGKRIPDAAIEARRLAKLHSFALLDTPEEHEFDTIVALAQKLVGVPIALVSLVDDHRQWFKARCGLSATETSRDDAFCAYAMFSDDVMVVEDATLDPRFADNPLVTGAPHIRFYAGVPLRPASPEYEDELPGIGTLCVIDTKPRTLQPHEAATLRELAGLVSALIRARASAATALRLHGEVRERAKILDRRNRQLRQAERLAGIGSWRLDIATQQIEWSEQVFAIHGLPIGDVPPYEVAMSYYPEADRARVADFLTRSANDAEPFDFESDFRVGDRVRRVRCVGDPEIVDGRPVALIGVFQDVTERHAREVSLRETADTDALTRLPNRGCFEARLDSAWAHARNADAPLGLLLIDLDGFKAVNDTLGHEAGDEVLRVIAERMRKRAFASAFSARLGGDEFVMLIERPRDCASIEGYISTLLGELRYGIERDGQRRAVSATIGAAVLDAGVETPADLLRRADLALYEAKRAQRGTGRIFGMATPIPSPWRPALTSAA